MDDKKKRKQLALLQRTQSQLDVQQPDQSADLLSAAREVSRSRMAKISQGIGQIGQMVTNALDAIPPSVELDPGPLDNLAFMGLAGISKGIKSANKIPTVTSKTMKMVTGPHSAYKGESSMIPHVVDIFDKVGKKVKTTKVYSSFKKALDVAKNYIDIPDGGKAFPRRMSD